MDTSNEVKLTPEGAKELFPNLDLSGFGITSCIDPYYNCFAWAIEETEKNCQPSRSDLYLWHPTNLADTVDNYIEHYSYYGFEVSEAAEHDPALDKIAIYVNDDGEPMHAARQLDNGAWTSKLSWKEDVEHKTLQCLEGSDFGRVSVILQRKKGDTEAWKKKAFEAHLRNIKTLKN